MSETRFPNTQSDPDAAIPVWMTGGVAPVPPGSEIISFAQPTLVAAVPLDTIAPVGATVAVVQVNAGIVRYLRTGVDPTGDVGMIAYSTGPLMVFNAPFDAISFIQKTGSTASLNIEWWGPAA